MPYLPHCLPVTPRILGVKYNLSALLWIHLLLWP
jgi:hypothetical protein